MPNINRLEKFEMVVPDDPKSPKSIKVDSRLLPDGSIRTEVRTSNLSPFQEVKLLGGTVSKLAMMADDELEKLRNKLTEGQPDGPETDGDLLAAKNTLIEIKQMFSLISEMGVTIASSFHTLPKEL